MTILLSMFSPETLAINRNGISLLFGNHAKWSVPPRFYFIYTEASVGKNASRLDPLLKDDDQTRDQVVVLYDICFMSTLVFFVDIGHK
ncbi:hypothetical protein Plhal703r1_c04g0023671 [Plasmopara halstedii]